MLLPIITEEHILPEIGCISECSWWSVCVCALCWSLFAAIIVKLSAVAHPGRRKAFHREIWESHQWTESTKEQHSEMQWASTNVSKSIISSCHCLGSCNCVHGRKEFVLPSPVCHTRMVIMINHIHLPVCLVHYGSILYSYADNYLISIITLCKEL